MRRIKSLFLILLAFVAGSFVSLVTTLAIAHGGDTNLVHACVRNNTLIPAAPNIRIVGANDNCNSNETALDWPKTAGSGSAMPFFCTGCNFRAEVVENRFVGKDMTDAAIGGSFARDTNFTNANFTNANLVDISGENILFINANLTGVNASEARLLTSDFQNANLTNANFTTSDLTGSTNMDTTTRTGVIWNNTTCPDGTNSNDNGNTCEGHLIP